MFGVMAAKGIRLALIFAGSEVIVGQGRAACSEESGDSNTSASLPVFSQRVD